MIKISIVRHSIRNRGGDKLILDYCDHLLENGFEIDYWTNEISTDFAINPKIHIHQIPYQHKSGTLFFTLFKKFNSDIVLVDLAIMAILTSFSNKKKVVYLAQDDERMHYSSHILRMLVGIIYWIAFSIFKFHIVAVSNYLSNKLNQLTKRKIYLVPNGINHQKFYRVNNSPYLSSKSAPITILLYARSDYRKGFDIGVKAIEELACKLGVADWELWIIGEEQLSININGLKIKHWGFLNTDDDLRNLLSVTDIYLSPSRHEGFGLMQLEAMACGNVMIATKGFPLVTNHLNGLIYNNEDWQGLANGMQMVITNKALFNDLQKNGYGLSKCFDYEKSSLSFEQLLKSLSFQ